MHNSTASTRGTLRRKVTISDVAEALGLTKGTVSRALNGYPDISPTTRKRVERKATEMGYRPLAQAQAIRTGRTRTIGLVLQTDVRGAKRPFLSDFLAGISDVAARHSSTLTLAMSTGAEMIDTLGRLIDERKADGFILPRTYETDARIAFLRQVNVPFVMFGRTADDTGCAWFDILGETAMADAVRRLGSLGHKRIAFVNGGLEYFFSHLREQGFRAGMAEVGLEIDETLVIQDAMSPEAGEAAVLDLMRAPEPPTAIIFAVDAAALGAYDAARRLGLTIGQDLSLVSYDGIPEGRSVGPMLTSFRVDSRHAGERLAQLLIRRIAGVAPEMLRETTLAVLDAGGSDGPPRRTSAELAAAIGGAHDRLQTKLDQSNGRIQ